MVIPEPNSTPLDSLPEIALKNANSAGSGAKIISQEKRNVHGQDVWCIKIASTVNKAPVTSYGYYYGGGAGTVQVITYANTSAFSDYEADFNELLNSFQAKANSTDNGAFPKRVGQLQ